MCELFEVFTVWGRFCFTKFETIQPFVGTRHLLLMIDPDIESHGTGC